MLRFALAVPLFAALALASPVSFNLNFNNPAWYNGNDPNLIGTKEDFLVKGISITGSYDSANPASAVNSLSIRLDFNFGTNTGTAAGLRPYSFTDATVTTITAADLFFINNGQVRYGIPLLTHSNVINTIAASNNIIAGNVYRVTNNNAIFLSDDLLAGTVEDGYGHGRYVWLNGASPNLSNVASGSANVAASSILCTANFCPAPEYSVTLTAANNPNLNALIAGLANGSLFPYFTGSTCGNDLITGTVPEPASLALVGGALFLVALRLRRK